MTDGRQGSPQFDHPPVVELVLAVEFVPSSELSTLRMLQLYMQTWSATYSRILEQPPLPPAGPEPGNLLAGAGLRLSVGASPIRLWMLSDDESQLLQLQYDRLILNWRRADGADYPSYSALREQVAERWADLLNGTEAPLQPVVVEATFVNRVQVPGGWGSLGDVLASIASPQMPGLPQFAQVQFVSSLSPADGGPGRVLVTANAGEGTLADLTISTRLTVTDPNTGSSVLERLDRAHDIGVATFVSLTPDAKQTEWGRTQ